MRRIGPWTFLFVLISMQASQSQNIDFDLIPLESAIVARSASNIGILEIAGNETAGGFQSIRLAVTKDGSDYSSETIDLNYVNGAASFSANIEIDAGLHAYNLEVLISDANSEQVVQSVSNLSAGDLFYINGQSNAESKAYVGSANHNTHPFIRSFSSNGNWVQALGNDSSLESFVGQWPLRMGRQFVERFQIPIGIVNQAEGGKPITYFQKNDANPLDSATNYGRSLRRLMNGNVANSLKAIFWYQGEFDKQGNISPEDYIALFDDIYTDWQADLGGFERIYLFQIRQGCGSQSASGVQEAQRRIDHIYPEVVLVTTTGIDGHDGCHFGYQNGYETLGDRLSFLVGQDIYGEAKTNFFSPTPQSLFYSNADRTQISITTQNPTDQLVFDSGSETYFSFSDRSIFATSGATSGNTIILNLNKSATNGLNITYEGHAGPGSWISNEKGVGLATFWQLPISVDVRNENPDSPSRHFTAELFPQPSRGSSTLNLKSLYDDQIQLKIFDSLGRLVRNSELKIHAQENQRIELDLSGFPRGKYHLTITGNNTLKYLPYIRY